MDKFKDECGVFGIFGHPEAANMTYLGLYALQHRGQESAGIAASDGAACPRLEGDGLCRRRLRRRDAVASARARCAIGHVRYSTAGESKLSNAQPILIDCAHGQIAICHNGNLVNAQRAARRAGAPGIDLPVEQRHRSRAASLRAIEGGESVEDAIVESVSQVQGAFSLAMMTNDRLIAVRDPHGFRPLALGRLGDATVICSETCAMDLIGATYVRDVEPGEVLVISAEGLRSIKPFRAGAAGALRVRARVFRAARQLRLRPSVNEVRTESRAHPGARAAGRRRRRRAGSRLRRLRGDGISPKHRASRCGWV